MLKTDVAIIGGGPAGSTVGTFLRKYNPNLSVTILEREKFPRDHVGESHLPAISAILEEMEVWDKVEAANFPIKIGATFKWGGTKEFWDTDFLHHEQFRDEPRPARFEDQRRKTAFQVDRSIYDKVLLDHARSMGCQVFEETSVSAIERDADRVLGLRVASKDAEDQAAFGKDGRVEAKYYVDCTGEGGLLRRAMDVEIEAPTALRNIAIYKYWQNAKWAVSLGIGGTRIQIMSIDWGWLWFIPITPTRTSVGLVLPASYYKASGKSVEQIYADAIAAEPLIAGLLADATPEPEITATKDWNFLSKRLVGENWFLAGDACGFADPILSAGMTLAHTGARKVAFTLLELFRGELDPAWLKFEFEDGHRTQIRHHMQFADFWYSSNGQFTDLKDYCREIAETAGLSLDPESAFRWLATGGFTIDEPGVAAALTYRVSGLKLVAVHLGASKPEWEISKTNFWRLNLADAVEGKFVRYLNGRVVPIPCLKRGSKILPLIDVFKHIHTAFKNNADSIMILEDCVNAMIEKDGVEPGEASLLAIEGLESLILEGWIRGKVVPSRPFIKVT
ncbi:MAG: NAD(P)/FAD-dependent oxidoreductase [Fimbriimonas sp.]|nr:NAD(P)/FAD-dependent oxidoreductase [Fimbriimonas sp.]